MKQVIQDLYSGATEVVQTPVPSLLPRHVLIRTSRTLISVGTERMLVDFARANLFEKARKQPERVVQTLEKLRTDGLLATFEAVQSKLTQPIPMGYSNVGVVEAVGDGVTAFKRGDRVVSNGSHAEYVCVPQNLCAKIPDEVSDDVAAFTILGSIALQGIRLIAPTLGETVFVSGLGLVGLIAIQLLRANGCKVLGADVDPTKCNIARHLGAEIVNLSAGEDPVAIANAFTQGRGVDAVLVAATTKSSSPIDQAAQMSRNRGRIVLVGVTGLDLKRSDFYEKELTFQVSRSYGPGRYDPDYEQRGNDYPLGFVRWTEQRNFDAVLSLMRSGALETDVLISQRFKIDDAPHAYQTLLTASNVLGVLLEYPPTANEESAQPWTVSFQARPRSNGGVKPVIGVIGAGQYASRVLVPALLRTPARLKAIASGGGLSATIVGRRFGFESGTTDVDAILNDAEIDAVVIATQHDSHAQLVICALEAGKSVFVEKPLALSNDEIDAVENAYNAASSRSGSPILMVGFNRRFSPLVLRMRDEIIERRVPFALVYTCNAGAIPPEHWTQREESGGGRIVGEACHFIDLARHLAGSPIQNISAVGLGGSRTQNATDTVSLQLSFKNGCIATIQYLANGHRTFPKERLEVFQDGRILVLNNFRTLKGFGVAGLGKRSPWRQNKGQRECLAAFVEALATDGDAPIAVDQIFEVSRVTVKLRDLVATAI